MRSVISPTSSRKMVPSSAVSSLPGLSRYAPVKLPFTWPKSSDSSRVSGRPAQLTAMNARSARGLLVWMARATSSLPTPLSPVMRTLASDRAMRSISWRSSSIGWLLPMRWACSGLRIDVLVVRGSDRSPVAASGFSNFAARDRVGAFEAREVEALR